MLLRYVLFTPAFWKVIISRCWKLSKTFSASIEIVIWFLIFYFNMVYHNDWLIDLQTLQNPCFAGMKPTRVYRNDVWLFQYVFGFCLLEVAGKFLYPSLPMCFVISACSLLPLLHLCLLFILGDWGLIDWDGGLTPLWNFPEMFELIKSLFFPKTFFGKLYFLKNAGIICESIRTWLFDCWNIFDLSFNFHDSNVSLKIFYFLLLQLQTVVLS